MMTFMILAPYAAFTLLMLVAPAVVSLFASAAICLIVIGYDIHRGREIKMLGAGSAILFAGLGITLALARPDWSGSAVKLAVDAGVLTIALASLAIRRPFTLQYAREMVDAQTAGSPGFVGVNYMITWAWTLALVLMMLSNLLMIYTPGLPLWVGIAVAFAARNTAVLFTKWYPDHQRARFAANAL